MAKVQKGEMKEKGIAISNISSNTQRTTSPIRQTEAQL